MAKLYIGTSGWVYPHWKGIFYPKGLSAKNRLRYFSQQFKTVEVNYSFYHLPRSKTYQNWYKQTPKDFLFSVKASRFITHIKRLKNVSDSWEKFFNNALYLKEKLGLVLFQFPSSFRATDENITRLEGFLNVITADFKELSHTSPRYSFEFRDRSWITNRIYTLFRKYNIAWVIADSPFYPKSEVVTADFVYLRMHGSKIMFSSSYTKEELIILAEKIKEWLKNGLDVYCYFNNDAMGYAVENAKELIKFCE